MNRFLASPAARIAFAVFFGGYLAAQPKVTSFEGDRGPGFAACQTGRMHCGLPEMDAAANGRQVVEVTWQNVRVYDYRGRLLQSTPTDTFIRQAGLDPIPPAERSTGAPVVRGPFEPHVVFDEFIHRWVVSVTGSSDALLVSASADPRGAWGGVNLSCLEGGPCLNADPSLHLGYDRNGVYYCGAHTGDDNPNTIPRYASDCFAVPAAEVAAIAHGRKPAHLNRAHNLPLDIVPAIDHDARKAAAAPAFFAAKTCPRDVPGGCQNAANYSFEWVVDSFTWNGTGGTWAEQTVRTDVGSRRNRWLYNKPCCGGAGVIPQAGNEAIPLRAVESHRLSNLAQFGSHLYGVLPEGPCTADCGEQGPDAHNLMVWFDLDCAHASACTVGQTGKISGDFNPAFPTIGVDAAGNVGIVAESSTASTDLSLLLWTRKSTDPAGTFQGPVTVAAGTQPYTCEETRKFASIGNAVGVLTARDPADGSRLWTAGQWSDDAARCVWKTRIVQYQIDPAAHSHRKSAP